MQDGPSITRLAHRTEPGRPAGRAYAEAPNESIAPLPVILAAQVTLVERCLAGFLEVTARGHHI
jgi:hypothetical protein